MPRAPRAIESGVCYHVLNRGNNRDKIFHKAADFEAFLTVLTVALRRFDVELLCWCLMPNHWHLVLRPRKAESFAGFMQWLTLTHVQRHRQHYPERTGHLYQGRFKAFPVQNDEYFLILCRYVEANPLRAKLVDRAEDWQWSSLAQRRRKQTTPPLGEWPVDRPDGWVGIVNEPLAEDLAKAVLASIDRQRPLGGPGWVGRLAKKLGLQQTLRPRGRPAKPEPELKPRQRRRRAAALGVK